MRYRPFGSMDINISAVGFGGGAISGDSGGYSFGGMTEPDAISLLHKAVDHGINLFDTAPCYGLGSSEVRMGKAFKDRREKAFIVSKSGVTWDENKRIRKTNDPKICSQMLEQSLKDLQTDYIDLYMIHWPDDYFDIRDTFQVLSDAKKAGKVRYLGLANSNLADYEACSSIDTVDAFQSNYNLFDRSPEKELLPLCQEKNLGFMSYGTLDKGILTGRVTPDRKYDKSDVRHSADWWKKEDRSWKFAAVEKIKEKCKEWNLDLLDIALASALRSDSAASALVGSKNPDQLASLCQSLEKVDDVRRHLPEVDAIVADLRPK